MRRRIVALAVACVLVALFAVVIDTASADAIAPGTYTVRYYTGSSTANTMRSYVTVPSEGANHPAVVLVHGGGWSTNATSMNPYAASWAAEQDWVTINVEYRVAQASVQIPLREAEVTDIRDTVAYFRANASTYGIDPDRIALFGASAGGHLALLAMTTGANVVGVAAWSPPTNLNSLWTTGTLVQPNIRYYLGCDPPVCPQTAADYSPVTHVAAGQPPVWMSYGQSDQVPSSQGQEYLNAANQTGAPATMYVVPGVSCHAQYCAQYVYGPTTAFFQQLFGALEPTTTTAPQTTTTAPCSG